MCGISPWNGNESPQKNPLSQTGICRVLDVRQNKAVACAVADENGHGMLDATETDQFLKDSVRGPEHTIVFQREEMKTAFFQEKKDVFNLPRKQESVVADEY